jgi:geranylgeranyl reductase family protein
MYDVIVVGGGPIGSYTARRLGEKGYKVLVLEKKSRIGEAVCCTGIVGTECAAAFDIEDSLILRKVSTARLFPPSGKELFIRRPEPQACILDRAAFDADMAERAKAAGAEYALGSRVMNVTTSAGYAAVTVSGRDRDTEIRSRAVVIAAGFNPTLLRRMGLGTYGDFAVGVQAEMEMPGLEHVEVYFGDIAPGFFAWLVPTTAPLARLGLLMRRTPGIYLRKWLRQLEGQGRIDGHSPELGYGAIPLRPLPRTYGERLVVVGDAAGQVKPTSGGGIYYGLLGADAAAATLHAALEEGDLSERRLARYERSWKKKLGRELTVGYWARRLFERLSQPQLDRIFEIVKSGNIDEAMLKAKDLSFDWHSKTILRLVKYQMVARTMNVIKLPFRTAGER